MCILCIYIYTHNDNNTKCYNSSNNNRSVEAAVRGGLAGRDLAAQVLRVEKCSILFVYIYIYMYMYICRFTIIVSNE